MIVQVPMRNLCTPSGRKFQPGERAASRMASSMVGVGFMGFFVVKFERPER
jgi:hypothetical protein